MEVQDYHNYLIYEDGSIYSKKRLGTKGGFLKSVTHNGGYLRVGLWKDGKYKYFSVHRLVALHYIPNPHNYEQVDHIDRDRQNNSIDNLRWVNHSMNQQNTGLRKDNQLQIKNIHYVKLNKMYKVQKMINGKKHFRYFKTLEEAIQYRDEYLTNLQLE